MHSHMCMSTTIMDPVQSEKVRRRSSQQVSLAHHKHIREVVQIHEEFLHRHLLRVEEEILAQLLIEGLHVRVRHPQLVILLPGILHKAVQLTSEGPRLRSRPASPAQWNTQKMRTGVRRVFHTALFRTLTARDNVNIQNGGMGNHKLWYSHTIGGSN